MDLNRELDFMELAKNVGLTQEQAYKFATGLDGQHTETMALARDPYTKLQTYFERALMEVFLANPEIVFPNEEDYLRPPFLYRTPKLVTPVHNPAHPRADVIKSMIKSQPPMAALLCNYEHLQAIGEMEHLQDEATKARLIELLSI
ncbi:hypothetical protein KKD70_02250, partial [Patescibacteria group bacterium]|nr:hypothetical protein [Patescibacteria group bacterium]